MPDTVGARRALIVGVGQYAHVNELPLLNTPANDVVDLAGVLRDPKRCRFTDVRELIDPDSQELRESIESLFTAAGRDDLVLLYFSGHGKLNPRGGLHLCATNTRESRLMATSIAVTEIKQFIDSTAIGQVVLVFDCCFSGAAEEGLKGDLPSLVRNQLGKGQGKYIMTSSSSIQVSRARPGERHSLFTKWLIEGLGTGSPDCDTNGVITIEELYYYASQHTTEEEPGQVPQNFTFEIKPGNVVIGFTDRAETRAGTPRLVSTNPVFFNAVRGFLRQRRIIPFLGAGIFGNGPLSSFRLASALAEKGPLDGEPDLATAAEYLEQVLEDRELFLQELRTVLETQSGELERNAAHDFILGVPRPPIVISATYDMLLERRLEQEHVPYTLISHVLYSRGGEHDGEIVVVRYNGATATAELWGSDRFLLSQGENELIIYKVLGSPFLSELADPAAAIDTVVVTEGDHLTFLGRLENQHTRVPDAFSIPFKNSRLLFLGYSLDLWNYRMVLRLFRRGKDRMRQAFTVRQPTSQMEELYWQRLPTDMIKSDPEQFAAQFVRSQTPALAAV